MAIEQQARHSPVLRHMIKNGGPLTRKRYVGLSFMGEPPDPWTAEHESMLPPMFQRDPLPKTASGED
jgi:hypothetical protein